MLSTNDALHWNPNLVKCGNGLTWAFPASNMLHQRSSVVKNGQELHIIQKRARIPKWTDAGKEVSPREWCCVIVEFFLS